MKKKPLRDELSPVIARHYRRRSIFHIHREWLHQTLSVRCANVMSLLMDIERRNDVENEMFLAVDGHLLKRLKISRASLKRCLTSLKDKGYILVTYHGWNAQRHIRIDHSAIQRDVEAAITQPKPESLVYKCDSVQTTVRLAHFEPSNIGINIPISNINQQPPGRAGLGCEAPSFNSFQRNHPEPHSGPIPNKNLNEPQPMPFKLNTAPQPTAASPAPGELENQWHKILTRHIIQIHKDGKTFISRNKKLGAVQFTKLRKSVKDDYIAAILFWYTSFKTVEALEAAGLPARIGSTASFVSTFNWIAEKYDKSVQSEIVISPECTFIVKELVKLNWPKGSKAALPIAVQESLNALILLKSQFKGFENTPFQELTRYLNTKLTIEHTIIGWFQKVHRSVVNWDQWSGSFKAYTLNQDKLYAHCRLLTKAYCGSESAWDHLKEQL